jgi:pimeloyl-ACP methyl ester carboxylesterase
MRAVVILTGVLSLSASVGPLRADDQSRETDRVQAAAQDGELRRRALFGAQFGSVTADIQRRQNLNDGNGLVIQRVLPGTSAGDAGFEPGDVILAVGGVSVSDFPAFLARMATTRAGDVLPFRFVRDGTRQERPVTLKEMPREQGDGYDVLYASVTSHGARLRTIITRPDGGGRHPAVLLLQGGHTCFPIDNAVGEPSGFMRIAQDLARHGYVTLRVERPGCGDSEGGPLRDVDFDVELDGYIEALGALKQLDSVDAARVYLFGHSMGGIMAPLMAVRSPVRGIVVFGTTAETWFESVFMQRRRLASLDGTEAVDLNREILAQLRFFYPLIVEKKTPLQIRDSDPELPRSIWDAWVTDDRYVYGRHYSFSHQIAGRNLTEAWSRVASTRVPVGPDASAGDVHTGVLSIWGTADWVGTRAASAWIAEVVNRVRPGNGSFVAVDSIDHQFFRAASAEESYRYVQPAEGEPAGQFNPAILTVIRSWLDETSRIAGNGRGSG